MAIRTSHRSIARRLFATAAATSLAVAGLAAAASPSDALKLQSVHFSVSTAGPAFTSTPIRADFTLSNPATNTGSVAAFTIVVPPGVGTVTGAGVTGPGNWREVVLRCGSTPRCSSLVLVYATLPLSTSVLKPGKSLIASIAFTTPSTPTSLAFKMIGIGNGVFTTSDIPVINVISGDAASFLVTDPAMVPAPNSTVAGQTQTFTVQAQNMSGVNVPYGPAQVRVELGSDDPWPATLQLGAGPTVAFTPSLNPVTNLVKFAVLLGLPSSATGTYSLKITFFTAAAPTSVTVNDTAKPNVKGNLSGFAVLAGPPTSVGLDSIKDGSTTPSLPNPVKNKALVAAFHLNDLYNNPTTLQGSTVTLAAGGPGTLGSQTVVDTSPGANPPALGTVTTAYSAAVPPIDFQLTLNPQSALSNVVQSPVDGSGASQTLTPGTPGGFPDPVCSLAPTDPVCSTADLPHGANGQVNLIQELCDPGDSSGICGSNPSTPVVTFVQGDLGTELYTRASPASMTLTCLVTACPDTIDNDFATDQSQEDIDEAIAVYPGWAKSSATDPTPTWQQLEPCQVPVPGGDQDIIPSDTQFCSDHSSYTIDSSGNLSFTVFYLTDPKSHP